MNNLVTSDTAFGASGTQREHDPAAPRETSDPIEILMRREIEIGINIRGLPLDDDMRKRIAIQLNITID